MLIVKDLSISVKDKLIIKNVNFSLSQNELVAITGNNGSGKTTLLNGLFGLNGYSVSANTDIVLDNCSLKNLHINERVQKGLFMAMQNPVSLPGINIIKLFRELLIINAENFDKIFKELKSFAKVLHFSEGLIIRNLNENFSGGEKKKMEFVQAYFLAKKYVFFDEIDSGLDRPTQKIIAQKINILKEKGLGIVVITHSDIFLNLLKIDRILEMKNGRITELNNKNV